MVRKTSPEKRAHFLNSALKLFVQNGVQQTSTAEITQDAGTAAGTLFLYFPTKQALVDELILNIGREQSEYINARLQPSLPARETFLAIWQGSIRWFLEHMDAYKYFRQVKDSRLVRPLPRSRANTLATTLPPSKRDSHKAPSSLTRSS